MRKDFWAGKAGSPTGDRSIPIGTAFAPFVFIRAHPCPSLVELHRSGLNKDHQIKINPPSAAKSLRRPDPI
jgi:hypothetical protein